MADRRACFIYSTELDLYRYPDDSPFKSTRAMITRKIVASMGLLSGADRGECPPERADRSVLERFHTPRYLDAIQAAQAGELSAEAFQMGLGTPDCPVFAGMYDYAALAAGATVTGARLILGGGAHVAFNPSGGYHHAAAERASGFCYVNDIALACMTLAEAGMKVMFIDVDVHHSDGVQGAFYERDDVLVVSFHESGKTLFPGTGFEDEIGVGRGRGYTVNVPLPVGTYDEAYLHAFREIALPLVHAYAPDVLVIEFGMDALAGDPLAHLNLTNNAYADIAELAMSFGKPILATGGGGYNVENTTRGWARLWGVFCGEESGHDLSIGLGGVMLSSTEWQGGLRDRALLTHSGQRRSVDAAVSSTVEQVKRLVFPVHGL